MSDLGIDLWTAPKPNIYPSIKKPTKPVYESMCKDDPNQSDYITPGSSTTGKVTASIVNL